MSDRSTVDVALTPSPGGSTTLTVSGTLDSSTYRQVRDSVIKAALDEPTAVLVDVSALEVPTDSAWTAFTSARWHVSAWPDVPVLLVCDHLSGRRAIARSGAGRYVPVHSAWPPPWRPSATPTACAGAHVPNSTPTAAASDAPGSWWRTG